MLEKLLQRHRNPLSWITSLIFLITLCLGMWLHNFILITVGIICFATSWFWFPKPKTTFKWSEQLIEAEIEFLEQSLQGSKAVAMVFMAVLMVMILAAFWFHKLLIGLLLVEIGLLFQLIWAIFMVRKAKKLIMTIIITTILVVGVLLIMFVYV
ncbi:MAG: hypothetical protein AMJ43_04160 [Coxiella sp. DG_40]|nr:MAG: hypothetical protein AMJ43_04160 [Coxiella sp. DG_40]